MIKHRNLPLLLLHGREQVMAYFRPLLKAHGITEQQWRIIRVLLDSEPLEPHRIGDLCRLSSASLAGVLSRMEALGLVARKRLANDRRRVQVSLTARSRRLAASMAPQIEAIYRRVEGLLGRELCDTLYSALDHTIAKLGPYGP